MLGSLEACLNESPRNDHRTVIVHFANSTEDQVARIARLGAVVSANPYYVPALADAYGEWWGFIRQGETTDGRANFRGTGPVAVDSNEFGMSPFGALNMAGNVSEWTANESDDGFVTSGGSWNDLAYSFGDYGIYPGFYTSNRIGFRCVTTASTRDQGSEKISPTVIPVYRPSSDADFKSWVSHYQYDRKPDVAKIVETVETDSWTREKITFPSDGGESATAWLYLPKNASRPLQVIHYVPPGTT